MNLIILKKNEACIELLIDEDFDIGLITMHSNELFMLKAALEKAMTDFMNDHTAELDAYKSIADELKAAGVIGYPVTPMKDARLYAADKKIVIESELEIDCD